MRRWLCLFLLVLLPLQFAWGAVARYCEHEQAGGAASTARAPVAAAPHLGHHDHVHAEGHGGHAGQQGSDRAGEQQDSQQDVSQADHPDCASCHFAALAPLLPATVWLAAHAKGGWAFEPTWRYPSHIPQAPERPDRPAAA